MVKLEKNVIEQIKYLYIEKNLSKNEICNQLNLTTNQLRYILKCNDIHKTKEQGIKCKKRVLMEKYGTDVPLKNKNCLDKMKQTNLAKYGYENPMQNKEIQQKVVETNLEKYGTKYGLQSEEVKAKTRKTNLEKYGVNYILKSVDIQNKIKQTNLEKYGTENVMQNKEIQQKLFKTNLEKYGSISPFGNNEIKEKVKQTNLEKYGTEYSLQNKLVREKIKQTNLEKYNCISPLGNKHIQNKIKQTNLEKYGVENSVNNKEIRNKIYNTNLQRYGSISPFSDKDVRNKIKQTNLERYGTEYGLQNTEIRDKCTITNIDKNCKYYEFLRNKEQLKQFLLQIPDKDRNVQYCSNKLNLNVSTLDKWINYHNLRLEVNFCNNRSHFETDIIEWIKTFYSGNIISNYKGFSKYEIDIYIPEFNLGIEFNGTYWHSNLKMDKNYHYKKSLFFEELGIRIIHIFEYEWLDNRQNPILKNIIKNAMQQNMNKIYARKCKITVKESKIMKDFFNVNNIQGFRGGRFAICLEYNNEIVMAYMMGHPYFGKGKYEWEVIRGATKLGYTVIGGASKIWKYFINNYNPVNCVYYIDYNYFNGNSLKNLPNMKYIKTQSSFKNWWVQENKIKNREPARNKEIKELYKENKVIPIYNAGTKVYLWEGGNNI